MLAAALLLAVLLNDSDTQHAAPGDTLRRDTVAAAAPLSVAAVRISERLRIDGTLDDAVWSSAPLVSGFVQSAPNEGASASERTEVRIVYDDDALYVGARLYDDAPQEVRAVLARRDRTTNADRFLVFLDCYHDRRTGFYFGVNAAGTPYDGTLFNDDWDSDTWDGVWEGAARRDSLGWTAELRIPYSQLRFQKRPSYRWAVNFKREIARKNEADYLVATPSNGSGFVSRFVELTGISAVQPPRRLEVTPYVTSRAEFLSHDAGDPFHGGGHVGGGAGADAKFGLGSNLTLDATVNPDFGQVEVDPAVVNLSDVETFFDERRPFFVEGASIFDFGQGGANDFWDFNWAEPQFLYTRRIGRTPQGDEPDARFSKVPSGTHILGAAKVTGKAASWNVGALSAVTNREIGRFDDGSRRFTQELEPLTYYGVARAQRELAGGRHGIGLLATTAARSFGSPALRDQLTSSAVAVAADGWTTLDSKGVWVTTAWAGITRVAGTSAQLADLQAGSVHYFQRPDADYLGVDSAANSMTGFGGRFTLNKQKGDWMVNSAFSLFDPDFEVNDVGFGSRSDEINAHAMVGRKWTRPGRVFRSWRLNFATWRTLNLGGNVTSSGYFLTGLFELRNFSTGKWWVAYNPETLNDRRTRGGPLTLNPSGVEADGNIGTDPNRRWVAGLSLHGSHYRQDSDRSWSVGTTLEWKPGARLSIAVEPRFERSRTTAQYVDTFDDGLAAATFGHRYVFADLNQTTLSASLRLNWIFSPKLSLEVYAQPLLSSGHYTGYKELARPRSYAFTPYPSVMPAADPDSVIIDPDGSGGPAEARTLEDPNFSLASLRGNAVLRWEYSPGSTLFLVWTQSRSDTENFGDFRAGHGLGRLARAAGDNIFLVKLSYWWNP